MQREAGDARTSPAAGLDPLRLVPADGGGGVWYVVCMHVIGAGTHCKLSDEPMQLLTRDVEALLQTLVLERPRTRVHVLRLCMAGGGVFDRGMLRSSSRFFP